MDDQTRSHYRRIRTETPQAPASHALTWARHDVEVDALYDSADIEEHGRLATATLPDGVQVVLYVDDEPYDWGDDEPTDHERKGLEVYGVAVRVAGSDDDLDSVWGVSLIWPSYREIWRTALSTALECGFIDHARADVAERFAMECRGVMTV